MRSIIEAERAVLGFVAGFENEVLNIIKDNKAEFPDYIREQLYSGLNGKEKPLRPTYLNDPWFNSDEAGSWKGRAKAYMKWKERITPPARSWLGYEARSSKTPNLIITGLFHDSIKATPFAKGLRIGSDIPMGGDIERKYGSIIFKPGRRAVSYFIKYVLKNRLLAYYKRWGIPV